MLKIIIVEIVNNYAYCLFESRSVTNSIIATLTEALVSKKPDYSKLILRTDNDS